MAIYDITIPLRPGMPTYDDSESGPELRFHSLISQGDVANVSALAVGSHTGTHVDAPMHFIPGRETVEQIPVEHLVGRAWVIDHPHERDVTAADLEAAGLPVEARRVLLKTANGRLWDDDHFHREFVALAPDGARWLAEREFVLAGIDYMSIETFDAPGFPVHHTLLEKGIVVVEALDLRAVPAGEYFLVCAPLAVAGADGAPARAFLLDGEERERW